MGLPKEIVLSLYHNWRQSSNGVIGVQFSAGAESIDLTDSRVAIVVSR